MQYRGGKYRLRDDIAAELINYLPESNVFIDMFCGAANISVAMLKKHPNLDVYANDISKPLITMFNALKAGWIPPDDLSKDQWIQLKADQDVYNPLTAFAGFGCSYAGNWFSGYATNTRSDDFCMQAKNSLIRDLDYIKKINFSSSDYYKYRLPETPVLIYCDIPYKHTSKYIYKFDHVEFYKWCEQTKNKGHTIIVSEYFENVEDVRSNNIIWCKKSKCNMGANGKHLKSTTEVLIKI